MEYKDLTLFAFGLLGVLLHCLVQIKKLQKAGKFISVGHYLSAEWATIAISVVVNIVAIMCKHEVKSLDAAGTYLGLGFVTLGYMGQSILIAFMGNAEKKIKAFSGDDTKTDQP